MGTRLRSCIRVRSRAGADGARIRGICACAARSLRKAIHRCTYTVYVYTMHACIYIHAHLATPTNGSPMRARRAHVLRPCARMCACALWRPRIRADTCERVPSASTAGGLGSQAFGGASAFNANIGAWNTARVTTLSEVCAAFCMHYTYTCMSLCVGTAGLCVCARANTRHVCESDALSL
jgi:hypothetical protein